MSTKERQREKRNPVEANEHYNCVLYSYVFTYTGASEYMVGMFTDHPQNSPYSRRAPRLSSIEHVACSPNDAQYRQHVGAFRRMIEEKLLSQRIQVGEVWRVQKYKGHRGFSVYQITVVRDF